MRTNSKLKEAEELEARAAELRKVAAVPIPDNARIRELQRAADESHRVYSGLATRMNEAAEELKQKRIGITEYVLDGGNVDKLGLDLYRLQMRVEILQPVCDAAKAAHESTLTELRSAKAVELEAMRARDRKAKEEEERKRKQARREAMKAAGQPAELNIDRFGE